MRFDSVVLEVTVKSRIGFICVRGDQYLICLYQRLPILDSFVSEITRIRFRSVRGYHESRTKFIYNTMIKYQSGSFMTS